MKHRKVWFGRLAARETPRKKDTKNTSYPSLTTLALRENAAAFPMGLVIAAIAFRKESILSAEDASPILEVYAA